MPKKHLDRTNSATLRRYHLMGVAVVLRRINRVISMSIKDRLEASKTGPYSFDQEWEGESSLYDLIAQYMLSKREQGRWLHLVRSGFEKGVRQIYDTFVSDTRIPKLLLSGKANPYHLGKRDQFVQTVLRDMLNDRTLVVTTLSEVKQLCHRIANDVGDAIRESVRLDLSPMEAQKRVKVVISGTLEDIQSFTHDEITRAYQAGTNRGHFFLRGLSV